MRFVKARGRFGDAEYIRNAVITNPVAGAKVVVRVVIKRTPAEAPRVLVIGRQLIVHPRMTVRVFAQALDVVVALRWIHVPVKFSVEVERVIRRPQRKSEIIHRENVFEHFRAVPVAHAAGLSRVIQRMHQSICLCV